MFDRCHALLPSVSIACPPKPVTAHSKHEQPYSLDVSSTIAMQTHNWAYSAYRFLLLVLISARRFLPPFFFFDRTNAFSPPVRSRIYSPSPARLALETKEASQRCMKGMGGGLGLHVQ